MKLVLWLSLFLIMGCGENSVLAKSDTSSPACMCDPDALNQAVLDRIFDSGIGQPMYLGTGPDASLESLKRNQVLVDKIWTYSKTLKDHCLQDAYVHWASFYQQQHDDAVEKIKHPMADTDAIVRTEEEKRKKREVEECKRRGIVPRIDLGELHP